MQQKKAEDIPFIVDAPDILGNALLFAGQDELG